MNTAYLYENFITRNIRFSNATALMQADRNATKLVAEVEGCYVTNTSSYVDVLLASNTVDTLLYKRSYIRFINGNDNTTYLAFIDRIEPNNFNPTEINYITNKAYRIFITIDWWSTIMWNDSGSDISNIKESLEGNVERAHVDDVVVGPLGYYIPTIKYSMKTPEVPIGAVTAVSKYINKDNNYKNIVDGAYQNTPDLMWFVGLFNVAEANKYEGLGYTLFTYGAGHGDGQIAVANAIIGVIPVKNGIALDFWYGEADDGTFPRYKVNGASPFTITDDNFIHGFFTTIPPFDYQIKTVNGKEHIEVIANKNGSDVEIKDFQIRVGESIFEAYSLINTPLYMGFSCNDLSNTISWYELNPNNSHLSLLTEPVIKPETYEEYISKNIIKADSEIYTLIYIGCGGERYTINQTEVSSFSCAINYETGGLYVRENNIYASGLDLETHSIGGSLTFRSLKTMSAEKTWQGLFSLMGSTTGAIFSGFSKNYGNMFQGIISSASNLTEMFALQKGNYQSQATGAPFYYGDNLPSIGIAYPYNISTIRKDLALYGYNTFLHPHEVLTAHERKYFNYIKCNNAQVAVPNYTTEIRLQIEEMFNNGVWLWNTASNFGNFEVPNYPIIMEN